jgi:D-alanine transaminase
MPRIAYVNGTFVPHDAAAVHIEDRGFQFSDSVYEVIAVHQGCLADAQGHFDRLERSLREINMPMPFSRQVFAVKIRHLLRLNKMTEANLYIQVTRGVAARDFKMPKNNLQSVVMTVRAASFDAEERKKIARTAITVPDIRWQRRDIKTTQLLAQSMAKQQALDAGADEALMIDANGFVTEASASNAWIVTKKGELITRQADRGILKGVTRSALQQLCKKEKIRIVERAFTLKEAYAAREIFTSAAVSMISPVVKLDGRVIGNGKPGVLTLKIMDMYMSYALNATARQFSWKAD